MRKVLRLAVYAALSSLAASACSCDDPPVKTGVGSINLSPEFLAFGDVCDEAEDVRSVQVLNQGRAVIGATLSIQGPGAAFFSIADEQKRISVSGNSSVEVFVTHSSSGQRNQNHEAILLVTPDGADPIEYALRAHVADVHPTPHLTFGCGEALPLCVSGGDVACCNGSDETRATSHSLQFGNVGVGEARTVQVTVTNPGCGTLKVTDIRIEKLAGDTCDVPGEAVGPVAVRDFQPFDLAGTTDPANIKSRDIEFTFTPTAQVCSLRRKFVFVTNDPNAPADTQGSGALTPASGMLVGEAVQGALEISPPVLVFGDITQGEDKVMTLRVLNKSGKKVTVDRLEIAAYSAPKLSAPDMFSIVKVYRGSDPEATIPWDQTFDLEKFTFKSDSPDDRVTVEIRYAPTRGGNHKANLRAVHPTASMPSTSGILEGSSNPKLVAYPPLVQFGNANEAGCAPAGPENYVSCPALNCVAANTCSVDADCDKQPAKCLDGVCSGERYTGVMRLCAPFCGVQTRTIALCNEGISNLVIKGVRVEGSEPGTAAPTDPQRPGTPLVFGITEGCKDVSLAPDQCCNETLTYTDPVQFVGMESNAVIVVSSTDPQWEEDARGGMPVTLTANTTVVGVNRKPRLPSGFIELPATLGGDGWITFSADDVFAPFGDNLTFKWSLVRVNSSTYRAPQVIDPANPDRNCTSAPCFRVSSDSRQLSIRAEHAGANYNVEVEVTGDLCEPKWSDTFTGKFTVPTEN